MQDAAGAAKTDELWQVWRRLLRALPWVRMPFEWFFSPSVYTLLGTDFVSGLLKNRSTKAIFAILEPLPPRELRRVHALAALNHRRHEVISRWTAIGFVTVPASSVLMLSQLSPETLDLLTGGRQWARWYWLLAYVGGIVALYLLWAWRARQLLTIVEIWMIQRGVIGHDGSDDPGEPVEPPLGV